MLEVKKTTTTTVSIDVRGTSSIDDDKVVRFNAHINPDEKTMIIMTILDMDKYEENPDVVLADEKAFEAYVCDSDQQVMTKVEEVVDLVNGNSDEPDDEPDGDDEPEDDDDKSGAGNEETIIP